MSWAKPLKPVGKTVITPAVVIRPTVPAASLFTNHKLPSGPLVIAVGALLAEIVCGIGYSWITPAVVIFPMALFPWSVNQRFPSGPATIPNAKLKSDNGKVVTVLGLVGVMRSIVLLPL